MTLDIIAFLVALAGLLMVTLPANPKVVDVGRCMLIAGMTALLILLHGPTLHR